MGALFGLPVFPELPLADLVDQLPPATVYGLAAHGGEPLDAADLRRPAVLVVGAERAGLSRAALAHVGRLVTIPLSAPSDGAVESLNAGVAGAIALYEFSRRLAGAAEDPSRRLPAAQEG
jgi:23S rRNA (guanosine2251-2'-O)-methyltransferase